MTAIAIVPESDATGTKTYRAVAGTRQSVGKTAGEALDALAAQLSEEEDGTLIVVQRMRPDRFFTQTQISRLQELMERWRQARDEGAALSPAEQTELNALIEAELLASGERAGALADSLGR